MIWDALVDCLSASSCEAVMIFTIDLAAMTEVPPPHRRHHTSSTLNGIRRSKQRDNLLDIQPEALGQRHEELAAAVPLGRADPRILDPATCGGHGGFGRSQQPRFPQRRLALPGRDDRRHWWRGRRR